MSLAMHVVFMLAMVQNKVIFVQKKETKNYFLEYLADCKLNIIYIMFRFSQISLK